MKEEWREIDGYPGYFVSSYGRILSDKGLKPLVIKQAIKKDRNKRKPYYLRVSLRDATGRPKNLRVHRLVLIAFRGPAPSEKHHGAHIDGNSLNNWLMNLKWSTQIENEADKEAHGTKLIGTGVANAKLDPAAVRRIRNADTSDPEVFKRLMSSLGVSRSTIRDVLTGRTWAHIK